MAGASQASKASDGERIGAAGTRSAQRGVLAQPIPALARLRLAAGGVTLIGMLLFVFGTSWDIQWHAFVGRDRALVPPHQLMLGGIVLAGAAALAEIVVETLWARRVSAVARASTPFSGAFYGSLGAYVAGFGALAAGVGFPLDVYWHALYGIDVSVWAPFHVQIITGMAVVALGAAYMLLSGANLAHTVGMTRLAPLGRVGLTVAAAAMVSALLFFLDAAFSNASLWLGGLRVDTYPLMVGLFAGFGLALVAAAWPGRFAASSVALVFYALDLLVFVAVPPLTAALVVAEQQSYRHGPPAEVLVSVLWPLTLILLAGAIDLTMGLARARAWSWRRTVSVVRWAAATGTVLVVLLYPIYVPTSLAYARRFDDGHAALALLAAVVLGAAAGWLGSWLGLELGASLGRAER